MTNGLLGIFIEHTYSRSDFAYRISLLREFLEFIFFTKHDARVGNDAIEQFTAYSKKSVADIAFLRTLPPSFLEAFTQESFYEILNRLSEESKQLKILSLTVPVIFARADIDALGSWAREAIGPDLLIEIDVDPAIAVGCHVAWNNQLHDFSFDHYLRKSQTALHEKITQRTQSAVVARS